ncbi:MAG: AraC family transcriptional regulator [Tissierellia bacterium]|nr:AraC family transcriptional regulator [Tissierellia bacterium]
MDLFDKNPNLLYCYENFRVEKNRLSYTVKPSYGEGNVLLYNIVEGLFLMYSDMIITDGYNYDDIDFLNDMFIIHHFISGDAFFHLDEDLSAFVKEGESLFYTGDNKYISGGSGDNGIVSISLFGYRDELISHLKQMLMLDDEISENMNIFNYKNEIFVCNTNEIVISLLNKIMDNIKEDLIFNIKRDALQLLFLDAELYPLYRSSKKILHKKSHIEMVEKAVRYMNENLESNISIDDICNDCGINKSTFKRVFPDLYGITPIKYLRNLRLEKGKSLLEEGFSVLETANMVGYQNPSKFSIAFKKKYGILPSKI